MTPQLQQAIKLLQLSNLELAEFVAEEIQLNPLLEEGGSQEADTPGASPEGTSQEAAAGSSDDRQAGADAQAADIESGAISEPVENFTGDDDGGRDAGQSMSSLSGTANGFEGEAFDAVERLVRAPSLRDHLFEQLNTEFEDPKDRIIGAALIEVVEPSGYLSEGDSSVAAVAQNLGIPKAEVDAILERMQCFDPLGVMARSVAECLSIQLRERDRFDPAMATLCANLDLLAERRFAELSRRCGVDAADLADMIAEIKALDPKPGERFDSVAADPVIPDILMRAGPNGVWIVELNPDTLPRLLVNRRYYSEVSRGCKTAKEREYLTERLNAANWLVRSLDQRANTILKVAIEIVRQQDSFFQFGVARLRPLVLRNIAEAISMHESTVSRVTTNKFISTPRGLFELKYFFSAAIHGSDGEASFAAESIRFRIKNLIKAEDPDAIVSDDTIVDRLQGEGIEIARRTVAKYREQLGIPSSVHRRREKGLAAASGV